MKSIKLSKARGLKTKLKSLEKDIIGKVPIFVLVHATWCFHCQNLRPEWDAAILLNNDRDVVVVEVDSDALQSMNTEHRDHALTQMINKSFQGFPHIFGAGKIKNNTVNIAHFSGDRTKKKISSFMRKKIV
jgi:hypothetical protein